MDNNFPDLKNGALVKAMEELKKNENPGTQANFVNNALKSQFFVPADIMKADGTPLEGVGRVEVPNDAKFNFRLIRNMEGENFIPIFTDMEESRKWSRGENVKTVILGFGQVKELVLQKEDIRGIVINPMGHNLIFTREILQKLDGMGPDEGVQQPKELLLGKPNNIPDSVLDAFCKTLSRYEAVNAVYFLMMKADGRESYLFVFDIGLENEEAKKIADSFCASARLFLSKYPIASAPMNSPFGEAAPNITEPFYKKG